MTGDGSFADFAQVATVPATAPDRMYIVYGLTVASPLRLPELAHAVSSDSPDVVVRRGKVGAAAPGLTGDRFDAYFHVPGVATYRIRGGSEIIVDAADDAATRNVRLYLLGSAFGALLHQRRLVPLHASAVEVGGKVVAFAGTSGAGKSTLAAWFHDQGHALLSDDVCVLEPGGESDILAHSGISRLRLWRDAVEHSGRAVSAYQRSWDGDEMYEKYDVPPGDYDRTLGARRLAAIYMLTRSARAPFRIKRLQGARALVALLSNTYRGNFLRLAGDMETYLSFCSRVVAQVPIYEIHRAWGWDQFDAQAQLIESHLLTDLAG